MSLLQRLARRTRGEPRGTVRVVDPNPLNWLYITYNTVEKPVRVTKQGVNAVRALAGVIDRETEGLPLHDPRARRALNLAVDRQALVRDLFGLADTSVRSDHWSMR